MNPEWVADTILLLVFVYGVSFALVGFSYALTRWRKMPFTFEQITYLVGGFLILGGGSMSFGLTTRPSYITILSLFFIAQGVAVMFLGYWKTWRDKRLRKQFKLQNFGC